MRTSVSNTKDHRCNSPVHTAAMAARLAPIIISSRRPPETWRIYLTGDVGAGKTAFVRALMQALMGGKKTRVPSPSYPLVNTYDTPRMRVHHIDCYRLQGKPVGDDILEYLHQDALCLVEWSDRAKGLPKPDMIIRIDSRGEHARQFHFTSFHPKTKRILWAL